MLYSSSCCTSRFLAWLPCQVFTLQRRFRPGALCGLVYDWYQHSQSYTANDVQRPVFAILLGLWSCDAQDVARPLWGTECRLGLILKGRSSRNSDHVHVGYACCTCYVYSAIVNIVIFYSNWIRQRNIAIASSTFVLRSSLVAEPGRLLKAFLKNVHGRIAQWGKCVLVFASFVVFASLEMCFPLFCRALDLHSCVIASCAPWTFYARDTPLMSSIGCTFYTWCAYQVLVQKIPAGDSSSGYPSEGASSQSCNTWVWFPSIHCLEDTSRALYIFSLTFEHSNWHKNWPWKQPQANARDCSFCDSWLHCADSSFHITTFFSWTPTYIAQSVEVHTSCNTGVELIQVPPLWLGDRQGPCSAVKCHGRRLSQKMHPKQPTRNLEHLGISGFEVGTALGAGGETAIVRWFPVVMGHCIQEPWLLWTIMKNYTDST